VRGSHYLFTQHISNVHGNALLTGVELGEDAGYVSSVLRYEKETLDVPRFLDAVYFLAGSRQRSLN
jgi:hypothetical protein